MAEQIRCPHCGQTWDISSEQARQYAGQTITCTNCQRAFAVPGTVYAIPAAQAASPGTSPAYAAQTAPRIGGQPSDPENPWQNIPRRELVRTVSNESTFEAPICSGLGPRCATIGGR